MNIKHAVLYVGIVQAILEQRTDFKLILERVTILGVQPGDSSDIADGLSGHVHHRLRLTSDSSDFVQHCITLYCNYENHICPFNIIVRYIQLFQFFFHTSVRSFFWLLYIHNPGHLAFQSSSKSKHSTPSLRQLGT